ncbi:MAG: ABC transporter substrate-binding protein [Brucella pseudogrignonensis]
MPSVRNHQAKAITRRKLIAALCFAPLATRPALANKNAIKIAALDWAWAESVVALGVMPMAVAEAPLYRKRVVAPDLAMTVTDLGLRSWPNMELLKSLHPDLIVAQAGYGPSASQLEPIAPVLALPLYSAERRPLRNAESGLSMIAARIGCGAQARDYLAQADAVFDTLRQRLQTYDDRPLLVIKFADDRLIDIYGPGSLFDDVLSRLGLVNGWQRSGSHWGFSTASLEAISEFSDARVIIVEPGPPETLSSSRLWNALPVVRARRVTSIAPTWVFGGLPSALRFADHLARALLS